MASRNCKNNILSIFQFSVTLLALCLVHSGADFDRLEYALKSDHHQSLSVLVVGDWGRKGLFNQSQVAAQVRRLHSGEFTSFQ